MTLTRWRVVTHADNIADSAANDRRQKTVA
jgi:hypothetical protein